MMKAFRNRWRTQRHVRLLCLTAMAVVWGVLLFGVAVPSWQEVRQRQAEIAGLEARLADLDRWTVAGLWLEPLVASREEGVEADWQRVFPAGRDREQLFLGLAEAADRCGVRSFQLEEIDHMGSFDMGTWSTTEDPADHPPAGDAPPAGWTGPEPGPARPVLSFSSYALRASFSSDYARAAAFLGSLERLERALEVRRLTIRPDRAGVIVELELEVFVSDPITS